MIFATKIRRSTPPRMDEELLSRAVVLSNDAFAFYVRFQALQWYRQAPAIACDLTELRRMCGGYPAPRHDRLASIIDEIVGAGFLQIEDGQLSSPRVSAELARFTANQARRGLAHGR